MHASPRKIASGSRTSRKLPVKHGISTGKRACVYRTRQLVPAIPSSRTQATVNQFRQPRLQLAWVEPKLNCVILILGSRWEFTVTLSAIRKSTAVERWRTFWPQVAPNLCSRVN
jgi:hypothetical protein